MSELPATQSLGDLRRLDPGLLYVFVAGPGVGEAIAVALPGHGWIFIDGCATRGRLPVRELFHAYRRGDGDRLVGLVLTHPHQDHAFGVDEVIEELEPGFVGVAGLLAAGTTVAHEYEALARRSDPRVTSAELRTSVVKRAVRAILAVEADSPGAVIGIHAGKALPLGRNDITITARSPEPALLGAFLADLEKQPELVDRANEMSTVLEVEFRQTRVVLGGDLPRFKPGSKRTVPTGWTEVLKRRVELGAHRGLKLPHHGSREAFHDGLNGKASERRAWWLTPYNSSRLPDVADLEGLPRLLKHEPSVHLTALPASKSRQRSVADPGIVRLDQLEVRRAGTNSGVAFADEAIPVGPEQEPEPLEPVWAAAFDDAGQVRGRWRGAVALEVLPAAVEKRKAPAPGRRVRKRTQRRK